MAGADINVYNAALKEVWTADKLEDQLYQGDPLLSRIERTDRYNIGEYALTPILTGRSAGYSVANEVAGTFGGNQALNAAGNATVKQAKWGFTHHYQQIAIEGSAIDQTSGNAVAVANAVDTEMTTSLQSLRKQLTRQLFTNSDAKIGTTSSNGTVTTITVAATGNIPANTAITRRWIQPGMTLAFGTDTSRTASSTGVAVTSINSPTTFTIPSTAVLANDVFGVAAASLGSATTTLRRSYELYGLPLLTSQANTVGAATYYHPTATTGFGNIDVASEAEWQSAGVDSTTTTLTLSSLYDQQRNVMQTTGESGISVIGGYKQQQRFYELLQAQVRFGSDSALGAGNVGGAEFAGMKFDAHVDCPDNFLFFVNLDDLLVVKGKEPYWQNAVTGGDPLVWKQGTTQFVGLLTYRLQLACKRRNSHAQMNALT